MNAASPLLGMLNPLSKSAPALRNKTLWTIRNNEDLVKVASARNGVMFGKARHRKPECMRSNERIPEIIVSGIEAYEI